MHKPQYPCHLMFLAHLLQCFPQYIQKRVCQFTRTKHQASDNTGSQDTHRILQNCWSSVPCHHSGTWTVEVASRFLGNLCTICLQRKFHLPVVAVRLHVRSTFCAGDHHAVLDFAGDNSQTESRVLSSSFHYPNVCGAGIAPLARWRACHVR